MSCWKIVCEIEIYIKFIYQDVFFTVPVHDVFNRKCFFYKAIPEKSMYILPYNEKKIILKKENRESIFTCIDSNGLENNKITFFEISEELFDQVSIPIDRVKLLGQPYKNREKRFQKKEPIPEYKKSNGLKEKSGFVLRRDQWCTTQCYALQILDWINKNFRHDGTVVLPDDLSGLGLYEFAKKENFRLNCLGMAILYYEMCTSFDILARVIICMPREIFFDDCHVVCEIYNQEEEQWMMIDPSYNVYFIDDNNKILSLKQIRKLVSKSETIKFNDDASYYGNSLCQKFYMQAFIRNLYRFAKSQEGCFGRYNRKQRINLVPDVLDYPDSVNDIFIDNSNEFWD